MTEVGVCCDRCPGATMADTSRFARRRLLKAAVFQPLSTTSQHHAEPAAQPHDGDLPSIPGADPAPAHLYRAVSGKITDISPHVVTIGDAAGERRYTLTADARAWRGATLDPAALSPGDEAVIRLLPARPTVADRIWANIGRVTGTIIDRERDQITVSQGATKPAQRLSIPAQASGRIEVRFPNLRPGYLVDIIGLRRPGYLEGLVPATSQPPYRIDLIPAAAATGGRVPENIAGSAVWHDSADEPYGVLGVSYPAIDPGCGCAEDTAAGYAPGQAPAYRELPYLAVGSALTVRNECAGISWTLPVTGCAPTARLFNDHCVACRISLRGRVADLTVASFVALGGELEAGCFSATVTIGR